MIEFIYKNLRQYEKTSHAILNDIINNNEKKSSSKLVGAKRCDIQKE